jgi:lipopolysaccharide/colanic/teichoic acid biosynthesis glycosyltransferase
VGPERFDLDRHYIEQFSLRLDAGIIRRTPLVVLRRTGSS